MQTASKQAGFGSEQGMNMRQDDVQPGCDDDDEAHGIAAIITDLAQSASEDKETINSAFTTMTATIKALQAKIEAMEKDYHTRGTITTKVIVELTVVPGIIITLAIPVSTKKLAIKMMQLCPIAKVVLTDFATINDK